jgi:hypothetical protein
VPHITPPDATPQAAGTSAAGGSSKAAPAPLAAAPPGSAGAAGGAARQAQASDALRDMGELGQEFLASSGMLRLRPPLTPAPSGSPSYMVQPYQILSWYPRCAAGAAASSATSGAVEPLTATELFGGGQLWRPCGRRPVPVLGCG